MRTVVTFHSAAFNTTEQKPYFINPGCFGDDLANWISGELRRKGLKSDDKPDQEDFGWYFDFQIAGIGSTLVLGYRPGDQGEDGTWIGWLERNRGFVGSVLGARNRDLDPSAAEAVHSILVSSPEIRDVRWHDRHDFDMGKEDLAASAP